MNDCIDDYISRKAALKAIYTSTAPALEVKAMPAADVVEVRHGRWLPQGYWDNLEICSECKHIKGLHDRYNYCPNCGAKMDGGQDE